MAWTEGWKERAIAQVRFKCKRCGTCCIRPPIIDIVIEDTFRLAKKFHSSPRAITKKYLKPHPLGGHRMTFIKVKPCGFYRDGCSIYAYRPIICRMAPFLAGPTPAHDTKGLDMTDMADDDLIAALVEQSGLTAPHIWRWLRYIGAWVD